MAVRLSALRAGSYRILRIIEECELCKGDHPANYKGCTVYRNLVNIKYKNNGNPASRQNPTIVHTPQMLDEQQNVHRKVVPYAQVAEG
jgi:hypothetical protein